MADPQVPRARAVGSGDRFHDEAMFDVRLPHIGNPCERSAPEEMRLGHQLLVESTQPHTPRRGDQQLVKSEIEVVLRRLIIGIGSGVHVTEQLPGTGQYRLVGPLGGELAR